MTSPEALNNTSILESLYILEKCYTYIHRLMSLVEEEAAKIKHPLEILFQLPLSHYIVIESNLFLTEFNGVMVSKAPEHLKERVLGVLKISLPIIDKIEDWKDIWKFVNDIGRNPFRDNTPDKKFSSNPDHIYDIPSSLFELRLLVHLISCVYELIELEFKEEIEHASMLIFSRGRPERKEIKDYSTLIEDLIKMQHSVDNRLMKFNKKYKISLRKDFI